MRPGGKTVSPTEKKVDALAECLQKADELLEERSGVGSACSEGRDRVGEARGEYFHPYPLPPWKKMEK